MPAALTFNAVLEAVEQLDDDAQTELIDVLRRRLLERRRQQIVDAVAEAHAELAGGGCPVKSVEQIVRAARA